MESFKASSAYFLSFKCKFMFWSLTLTKSWPQQFKELQNCRIYYMLSRLESAISFPMSKTAV